MNKLIAYSRSDKVNKLIELIRTDCDKVSFVNAASDVVDEAKENNIDMEKTPLYEIIREHYSKLYHEEYATDEAVELRNLRHNTFFSNDIECIETALEDAQYNLNYKILDKYQDLIKAARLRISELLVLQQRTMQQQGKTNNLCMPFVSSVTYDDKSLFLGVNNVVAKGRSLYGHTKILEYLFDNGRLYEDSDTYILNDAICAAYFLNYIINNAEHFDFNVKIIHTLKCLVKKINYPYSSFANLEELSHKTLEILVSTLEPRAEFFNDEVEDDNDFSIVEQENYFSHYHVCLGGNESRICSYIADSASSTYNLGHFLFEALHVARTSALLYSMVIMSKQLIACDKYDHLNGDCYFKITDISLDALEHGMIKAFMYINNLLSTSDRVARFYLADDSWHLSFVALDPFELNYVYKQPSYSAVANFLSQILSAKVEVIMWLND